MMNLDMNFLLNYDEFNDSLINDYDELMSTPKMNFILFVS